MILDKIILFGIFIVGYLLSLEHFKYIGSKFREIVQSQLLRILLMIGMFCIAGYFQGKIKNFEVLSISTVIISLSYALFMGICIRILYYKNPTN
jgi:hypothetical protein